MKAIKFNFLCIFSFLFLSFSTTGQVTVLDNLGEANGTPTRSVGDPTGVGLANLFLAQEFTTGTSAYSGNITLTLNIANTGGASTFTVNIYSESGGSPNASILTLSGSTNPAPGNAVYTGAATFAANTSYFIVISAPTSSPTYQINIVDSPGNINAGLGYSAPDEVHSSNGGSSWSSSAERNKFSLQLDAVVPVELVEFKAQHKESINSLEWITASETNNDYFEIQHSLDGENFDIIGLANGAGTTDILTNYSFDHREPSIGINYYRLRQIDFDGKFEYSEIISLTVQNENEISIFPIPATDQLTIRNGKGAATIFNILGQRVNEFRIVENQEVIYINNLPSGNYFLQIQKGNGKVVSKQFIKD